MSLLKIKLLSKEPVLFGQDNRFMTLGKMEARGDVFVCFMDLQTGKTYVEEAFAAWAAGQRITSMEEVKDDKLWAMLTEAAQKYGVCMVRHIADNLKKVNAKLPMPIARTMCVVPSDMEYFKQTNVIK